MSSTENIRDSNHYSFDNDRSNSDISAVGYLKHTSDDESLFYPIPPSQNPLNYPYLNNAPLLRPPHTFHHSHNNYSQFPAPTTNNMPIENSQNNSNNPYTPSLPLNSPQYINMYHPNPHSMMNSHFSHPISYPIFSHPNHISHLPSTNPLVSSSPQYDSLSPPPYHHLPNNSAPHHNNPSFFYQSQHQFNSNNSSYLVPYHYNSVDETTHNSQLGSSDLINTISPHPSNNITNFNLNELTRQDSMNIIVSNNNSNTSSASLNASVPQTVNDEVNSDSIANHNNLVANHNNNNTDNVNNHFRQTLMNSLEPPLSTNFNPSSTHCQHSNTPSNMSQTTSPSLTSNTHTITASSTLEEIDNLIHNQSVNDSDSLPLSNTHTHHMGTMNNSLNMINSLHTQHNTQMAHTNENDHNIAKNTSSHTNNRNSSEHDNNNNINSITGDLNSTTNSSMVLNYISTEPSTLNATVSNSVNPTVNHTVNMCTDVNHTVNMCVDEAQSQSLLHARSHNYPSDYSRNISNTNNSNNPSQLQSNPLSNIPVQQVRRMPLIPISDLTPNPSLLNPSSDLNSMNNLNSVNNINSVNNLNSVNSQNRGYSSTSLDRNTSEGENGVDSSLSSPPPPLIPSPNNGSQLNLALINDLAPSLVYSPTTTTSNNVNIATKRGKASSEQLHLSRKCFIQCCASFNDWGVTYLGRTVEDINGDSLTTEASVFRTITAKGYTLVDRVQREVDKDRFNVDIIKFYKVVSNSPSGNNDVLLVPLVQSSTDYKRHVLYHVMERHPDQQFTLRTLSDYLNDVEYAIIIYKLLECHQIDLEKVLFCDKKGGSDRNGSKGGPTANFFNGVLTLTRELVYREIITRIKEENEDNSSKSSESNQILSAPQSNGSHSHIYSLPPHLLNPTLPIPNLTNPNNNNPSTSSSANANHMPNNLSNMSLPNAIPLNINLGASNMNNVSASNSIGVNSHSLAHLNSMINTRSDISFNNTKLPIHINTENSLNTNRNYDINDLSPRQRSNIDDCEKRLNEDVKSTQHMNMLGSINPHLSSHSVNNYSLNLNNTNEIPCSSLLLSNSHLSIPPPHDNIDSDLTVAHPSTSPDSHDHSSLTSNSPANNLAYSHVPPLLNFSYDSSDLEANLDSLSTETINFSSVSVVNAMKLMNFVSDYVRIFRNTKSIKKDPFMFWSNKSHFSLMSKILDLDGAFSVNYPIHDIINKSILIGGGDVLLRNTHLSSDMLLPNHTVNQSLNNNFLNSNTLPYSPNPHSEGHDGNHTHNHSNYPSDLNNNLTGLNTLNNNMNNLNKLNTAHTDTRYPLSRQTLLSEDFTQLGQIENPLSLNLYNRVNTSKISNTDIITSTSTSTSTSTTSTNVNNSVGLPSSPSYSYDNHYKSKVKIETNISTPKNSSLNSDFSIFYDDIDDTDVLDVLDPHEQDLLWKNKFEEKIEQQSAKMKEQDEIIQQYKKLHLLQRTFITQQQQQLSSLQVQIYNLQHHLPNLSESTTLDIFIPDDPDLNDHKSPIPTLSNNTEISQTKSTKKYSKETTSPLFSSIPSSLPSSDSARQLTPASPSLSVFSSDTEHPSTDHNTYLSDYEMNIHTIKRERSNSFDGFSPNSNHKRKK